MAIWIKQNVGQTAGRVFGTSILSSVNYYIQITVAG
jgi:hypothetical protein